MIKDKVRESYNMQKVGWIIYNGNLKSDKFLEQIKWLKAAGEEVGFQMELLANNEQLVMIDNGQGKLTEDRLPDFVVYWDKDLYLARQLESQGVRLFNRASAIEICDDKALTFQVLANQQIRMPKTIIAPKIFGEMVDDRHLSLIEEQMDFPLIVKEAFGSFGQQVYMVHTKQELREKAIHLANKPYLIQEFIHTSRGKDIRLQVIGEKVVASMLRISKTDFRANITAGGKMYPYHPTKAEQELAIRAAQIVGADFAGVDLLFGEDELPVLCEVNSNAHFKNMYDCTGVDVAQAMMEYIKDKLIEERHK